MNIDSFLPIEKDSSIFRSNENFVKKKRELIHGFGLKRVTKMLN